MSIPYEYDDSARIDGASTFGIYSRIILPMSKPALATVAIFSFLWSWNDFMGPLIYLNSPSKHTLAIALQFANTGAYGPRPNWAYLMAASLVTMSPCLLLFFFAQRLFIQGVVVSGLKG
jgi:ABC-type glycerol-3-phosphate transport system permease component